MKTILGVMGWVLFGLSLLLWGGSSQRSPRVAPGETGNVAESEGLRERIAEKSGKPMTPVSPSTSNRQTPVGSPAEAKAVPAETIPSDPAIAQVVGKSSALVQKQMPEKALSILEEALKTNPDQPELNAQAGRIYWKYLNQPEKAIPHFEKSLQVDPYQPELLPTLVQSYRHPERIQRGQTFFKELAETKYPRAVGPAVAYADLMAGQGKVAEAAAYLERRAPELEDPGEAYVYAGGLNLGARAPEKAASNYSQAIKLLENSQSEKTSRGEPTALLDTTLQNARLGLAQSFLQGNRLDEAQQVAAQAVKDRPDAERAFRPLLREVERRRQNPKRNPGAPAPQPVR